MDLFDKTFNAIEKKLDLHLKRHSVLSGNVANFDTPNYRAREVDFAGELQKALDTKEQVLGKTNARHLDLVSETSAHIIFDNSGAVGSDNNNVDLDIAMGKLSANSRAYQKAVTLLSMKLRMMQQAARGRAGF